MDDDPVPELVLGVVVLSSFLRNSNWFYSHSDQWARVFIFQRIAGVDLCQVGDVEEDGLGLVSS